MGLTLRKEVRFNSNGLFIVTTEGWYMEMDLPPYNADSRERMNNLSITDQVPDYLLEYLQQQIVLDV